MTFDKFNSLATGDPFALTMALDLVLDNGRFDVSNWDIEKMSAHMQEKVPLIDINKCVNIISYAKELSDTKTRDLMAFIKFSGLPVKYPGTEYEQGICPICGASINYGNDQSLDDGGVIEWECPECGATGKEGYNKVFDRHYEVRDVDGAPIEGSSAQLEI